MSDAPTHPILTLAVQANGDLDLSTLSVYVSWFTGDLEAILDGTFTADELEAIAWWMRNH